MSIAPQVSNMASEKFTVAVIGAGFSGICSAIKLKEKFGDDVNLIVFEKAAGVGGTWYLAGNYPGAACDVPSHFYSFSFAQNPNWTRHFSSQKEIQQYVQDVANKYNVMPHIRFGKNISELVWREGSSNGQGIASPAGSSVSSSAATSSSSRGGASSSTAVADGSGSGYWELTVEDVKTGKKETVAAKFVISGNAPLCEPCYPDVPGREEFRGKQWHSARWDWSQDVSNKTVAVIGTGASAVQIVPEIAKKAKHVYVFQRTPGWVTPRLDFEYSWWFKNLLAWFPPLVWLYRLFLMLYFDMRYWAFIRPLPFLNGIAAKMSKQYMQKHIKDQHLLNALTPNYALGCKRVLLSDDWYQTLALEHVTVIPGGVSSMTKDSVIGKDGVPHKVDVIVYGTGFDIEASVKTMKMIGRGGVVLKDQWDRAGGPEAYLGLTVPHFPNLFFSMGPNTGLGHSSMITMIEAQVNYAVQAIAKCQAQGWASIEVKQDVHDAYNKQLQRDLAGAVWGGCISWYNLQGQKNITMWPWTVVQYWWATRKVDWKAYDKSNAVAAKQA